MESFSLTSIKWDNYELTHPEWLWVIPLFILINMFFSLIKNKYLVKSEQASFSDISYKLQLLHPLISLISAKKVAAEFKSPFRFIHSLVFIMLIFALSQPVRIAEKLPEPPQERDITFIVDTSVSMMLRDYILNGERIDRMSLLKGILDDFIRKLKGERISIIVFGDSAYTLVPLTSDQLLLRRMLTRIEVTMSGRFNAIGEAIALAVKQSTQSNSEIETDSTRKRILVLLTDADQPTGKIDPYVAAKLAKKANLPLYTIAIGASNISAQEYRQGGLLYSPVDTNLIKQLSEITGAKSYQAGKPEALENAIQAINLHETNKRKVKPLYFHEPLYFWLLILAFILFSVSQIARLFATSFVQKSSSETDADVIQR